MKFQVDSEEYLALLGLKSTVEAVLKVWDADKEFATPGSLDVFFEALRKEAAKIPPQQTTAATVDFL